MITLIRPDEVKNTKHFKERKEESMINIPLIGIDEVAENKKLKTPKIDKKVENIKENVIRTKKYHLLRWKIKRFLIQEYSIKKCFNWKTILDIFDSEIWNKDDLTYIELKEIFSRYGSSLIEHHTKYREIHGMDETIWMTNSEHRSLHNRLRRDRKCNIPSEELTIISLAATKRTEKNKKQTNECIKEYCKTDIYKEYIHERMSKIKNNWIFFLETVAPNIQLYEEIVYNNKTGNLTISSGFRSPRIKLQKIMID